MKMGFKTFSIHNLVRLWILCLLLNAAVAMHKGSRGVKGGSSSSSNTRRFHTQSEPQVSRSHYSETQTYNFTGCTSKNDQNPRHFTVTIGEDVILCCDFEYPEEKPVPDVIQWYKQGIKTPIYMWYDGYPPYADDGYEGRVSLAEKASLNLTNVHESDHGWYECKVYFLNRPQDSPKNGTWVHLDVHGEPQVSRSHYSESAASANRQCLRPMSPNNGQVSCRITNDKYSCTGSCLPGYTFPDGSDSVEIECSKETGEWLPQGTFEDCSGAGGGGYGHSSFDTSSGSHGPGNEQNLYSQGGYSRTFSRSSTYGGGTYGGGSYAEGAQQSSLLSQVKGCEMPQTPANGRHSCSMSNGQWTCQGMCNPGYKFSDGTDQVTLSCNERDGIWSPRESFENCTGSGGESNYGQYSQYSQTSHRTAYGGGTGGSGGRYSQESGYGEGLSGGQYSQSTMEGGHGGGGSSGHYSQSTLEGGYGGGGSSGQRVQSSHQGSYVDGAQSLSQGRGQGLCGQPSGPSNGFHSCSMSNGQWSCQGTCNPGYEFPDGTRQAMFSCHDRDGKWSPKKDFDDCILLCHPKCENGGRCAVHNQCQCPSTHRGNRCQYSIQLCDIKRLTSENLFTDCRHLSEYTECHVSCPPGMTFNPPTASLYRCTVDGLWNPPVAPKCIMDSLCEQPPSPINGRVECQGSSEIMLCKATCESGYVFEDGFQELSIQCVRRTGVWSPTVGFPDCEPICSPECMHGGKCIGHNSCLCPKEYRGSRCEYPLANCDGHERFASVGYKCRMTDKETVCNVSCSSTGMTLQPPEPITYTCSLDGTWHPDLKPICVGDYSHLIDVRTSQHGNYEGFEQGEGWQQSHSSRSQQHGTGQRLNYGGYEESRHQQIGHEFGGQQLMNHEFGGQQRMGQEFDGQQRMGHEFGGQQQMDYEFNEFGGQQQIEHEFGEFGGQQTVDHEFSNVGGQQQQRFKQEFSQFEGQQRMGHEFDGQQQMGHEFGGQQQMGHEFEEQQQVNHEFVGQQQTDYDFDEGESIQKVQKTYEETQYPSKQVVTEKVQNIDSSRQNQGLEEFSVDLPESIESKVETEIEDERFQLKGNDAKEIIKTIGDDSEVSNDLSIFSVKRKVSKHRGICSAWGFYHYRTFDGSVYTFPSSCWYVLAANSENDLGISLKTVCSHTQCHRIVAIHHANYRYLISYTDGIIRNNVQLSIPVQDENLIVEYISRYLVVKTPFGYTIWINEENSVLISAEPFVQNQTTGMCGNFDGTPNPLFVTKDGTETPDIFAFTSTWKFDEIEGDCIEEAELKQPCNSENREKRMEASIANLACAAFYDDQFKKCGEVLDVEEYYLLCQMDCCSMSSVEDCQCASLGEFVLECSRAGVDMSEGWREAGLCPLTCTNGTEYRECGPTCPPTCADQQPVCNTLKCVDGCHCPEGTVLEKGQCIPIDSCPCHYEKQHYASGETIQQDCNTCVCQGGNWQCTESVCPPTCSVSGPHILTFDGFTYDFQGKCSHYLVDADNFNIAVDYGTDCRELHTINGVCVKSITIHTPEEAIVKLKPSMEVVVNGREMTSLPISAPGIHIGQSTSTFMRAQLKNGLEIFWDLRHTIQVFAPVEMFGSLRALCGTFTKSQQDEFLTPEGDVETSAGAFTQKWRVEDSCRDVEEPLDPEGGEKACDLHPERRDLAAEICNIIKGPEFEECHHLLDYGRYHADCMEDVCSCEDEPVTCTCLSLANFAYACARKGQELFWRQAVPACGVACPPGQVFQSCADPCSYSCSEIANAPSKCRELCVEGCVCPPGQTLNEHGICIPVSSCSCVHSGHYYPPEFLQRRGKEMCECSQGNWDCHAASAADLILTPPPNIAPECNPAAHQVPTDCMSDCPLTCANYHHHQPCTVAVCSPGCKCKKGFVLDTTSGNCVEPHDCPCHHGGRSYEEGEQVTMDCNKCVCEGGSWNCDTNICPGLCSAWGDAHFETFDGKLYDFEGTCEYVLVKARVSDDVFFSVTFQNVPCGMGSQATCGKTVSVKLGDSNLQLTRLHPLPSLPENSRLKTTQVGMFTLVESDIGISVQWDRNTRVYVTVQPIWKNKVQGLCGDFNGDASDDFRAPSGGMPIVLAKNFADSWRLHKFCPTAKQPGDACDRNHDRRNWARHKCGVLKTDLFKPCHYQVEVEEYYKRCVSDACACNLGGDCECVCAVIGAYALKCARSGVVIPWRSQELCPVQCESCDRYSPCISLCSPPNCDTYLDPPESQSCSREYCVDGCEPKPCKPGHVRRSASNFTCIPEDVCREKPCIIIEGVAYREGERIERPDMGDACQSCYCHNGQVECLGVPCTCSTMAPLTTYIEEQTCEFTGWTEWINSVNPDDNEGNDAENLEELVEAHRIPCPVDHVRSIECRSAETQQPVEALGQNVKCSARQGLFCLKDLNNEECADYEIRVYCDCLEKVTCPPEQTWKECAFDCDHSCQSLKTDLGESGICDGQKCASGCVKTTCQLPLLARDSESCVKPEECTCKLGTGYVLAPGQVVTNGCEKCQCLNNTLICSTILECKKPPPGLDQIKKPRKPVPPMFEEMTEMPKTLPKVTTTIPGGVILELTTPACSYWSRWIDKSKPKKSKKHGEKEDTRPYMLKQTEGFCKNGVVTSIECKDLETGVDYSETKEEKLVCKLSRGFQCQNRHQPDGMCRDYKIRYFCSCSEFTTTPVSIIKVSTTPAYTYPCSDFVPLIDGSNPLPDTSLKASSSKSPLSGPDAARLESKGIKKAWTPKETNEKQFIEVDLGDVRGVYGIVTKGKKSTKEFVTSYQLLYSSDGISYSYYQDESDNIQVFNGNFDNSTEVKHVFKRPFEARFVRLEPLSWETRISLRLELLGCSEALTPQQPEYEEDEEGATFWPTTTTTPAPKECLEPIGLETGALLDSQLSASSSFSSAFTAENARLGSDSVWAAADLDENQYLQVDFLDEANVTGIVTKGREDIPQWVTAYTLSYSKDGETWNKIKKEDGSTEFAANYDQFSQVTNELPATVRLRYLRIQPTNWKNWISMQIEILGCHNPMPCRESLGADDGIISNYQLTASSKFSDLKSPSHGRLSSFSSWTPAKYDKDQFLQIDLLEPVLVTGIITKGDPDVEQWVKSYYVGYSNDSINWRKVESINGRAKEFAGNADQDSPVINIFPISVITRYVRVLPTKWHRMASLRVSLLGCKKEEVCREPMGLENSVLSDAQITASSSLDWTTSPAHARISDKGGWVADSHDESPYLQVDFLEPRNVSAVVTKGIEANDYKVTKYKVTFSDDAEKWIPVTDNEGDVIIFDGNEESESPVINVFPDLIEARYFRILPVDYENKVGLRLEILGCYHPYVCQEPLGMKSGEIYDFQITASSFLNPELSPVNARLDSDTAWVPASDDEDPYIQVDLMVPTNITGLMTRGRNDANEWVSIYEIAYSNDGLKWKSPGDGADFVVAYKANYDNESPVTNLFETEIFARFLRIQPTLYERKTALRFEILGCLENKVCMDPMGLENGLLPESQITASSYKSESTKPSQVGLNSETSWSASTTEEPQYIQIDFGEPRNISAVITKGSGEKPEWVSAYQVLYSDDADDWKPIKDNIKGQPIDFTGNVDENSPVINVLPETVEAQYIKIVPTDWKNWISLRAEILGCYHPYEPIMTTTFPPDEVLPSLGPEPVIAFVETCPHSDEVEDSLLKEARIEASSSTLEGEPSRIPLDTPGDSRRSGGWVPRVDDLHPVLMIELPEMKLLTAIDLQGREDKANWVKTFRVIGSQDNKTWLPVFGPNGHEIIEGNRDQKTVVTRRFKTPMDVKYVKIIPESWHRWPSLRLDLKGCSAQEVTTTSPIEELKLCPELVDQMNLAENCPKECPQGMFCNGEACVDPIDCPCVLDGILFKVSDKAVDESCRQCDCVLGGHSVCTEKACPPCSEDERSVLNDDCTCSCKACEDSEKMCPTNHECIPKQRWCDGIVDCPDDEMNCIYTKIQDIKPTELVPVIPPEPENATCDIMGKHIKTFDDQDITYEICHHIVMKDTANGAFNATLHKDCDFTGDCKHWLELKHKNHNIKVFSDLKVEFNGHNYTASQLPKLGRKNKAKNLVIQKVGDQIIIKSLTKGYSVSYDNKAHLKIEVIPSLMERLGGLCGFYSGKIEDDQKKPDGKLAFTSREFGDSWATDKDSKDCAPLICPHELMSKALDQCNKLSDDPFKECSKTLQVDHFIEFCMGSTCECMLHKNGSEKCKCDSFQTFAEACEEKHGPAAVRNWRFMHECHSECPPGIEWNDCGPSCQLTCDSSSDTSLEQCSEKCVPGCFCPPGTVLNGDKCVPPEQCADQACTGFGDPHFKTFDGFFFPFMAEGSFLIVGNKENDFVLNGISRKCSLFSRNTCLVGLEVTYKGHKVIMKKKKEVQVDGVSVPMDKLPIHSHGMIILGYPGRTFVVSIPLMSLEARYYEENSGFAVKVPSRRYFNKTEGLCGNCDRKKEDEKNKPLHEFVCENQVEGDPKECEKSMKELPVIEETVPICEKLENPTFEACYPLVDIEIFIDACSFDAVHSGEAKAAFCKTAKEYARQCCQAGLAIEDWPKVLGCDVLCPEDFVCSQCHEGCPRTCSTVKNKTIDSKCEEIKIDDVSCPEDFVYSQCHEGCPQTCSTVKNKTIDSKCDELKIDGCFCPEGKVLRDGTCVDSVLCDTCDEEGHVPGDEWKEGSCETCHCRSDLTIACVVELCPSKPICSVGETLAKVDQVAQDSPCCEIFICVPKLKDCPTPLVPHCQKGEAAKIHTGPDSCNEFRCECDPALCPPVVWPSELEEGQTAEVVNDSCCQTVEVVCHRGSCPEKPECNTGLELIEIEEECCTRYKCKPLEDICLYTHEYKLEDGVQIPVEPENATPVIYKPEEEWKDGLCISCKCVKSGDEHVTMCTVDNCPTEVGSLDYVVEEVKVPGKCCPSFVRRRCKDTEGIIHEVGEQWTDPINPCVHYICEDNGEEIQKTKIVTNCTECPRTAVYFPPSKILGQCCGICEINRCEDGDVLHEIGETWENPEHPCRKAECIREHGTVMTVYTAQQCPVIPKDCPKDKIILDESGCCEMCNLTSEVHCSSAPIPEEDTIGFFKYPDESHGGMCVNEKPVPNVLQCAGACHSRSYYSLEDGDFKDTCKCCKVNITVPRTIDLICPDGNYIKKTFMQPETCQCSKCAPKSTPEVEKLTKQFKELEQSEDRLNPFDIGQVSRGREEEFNPFQQLEQDQQVQQQHDFDDIFDIQQQQTDYDIFDTLQQVQQDHK